MSSHCLEIPIDPKLSFLRYSICQVLAFIRKLLSIVYLNAIVAFWIQCLVETSKLNTCIKFKKLHVAQVAPDDMLIGNSGAYARSWWQKSSESRAHDSLGSMSRNIQSILLMYSRRHEEDGTVRDRAASSISRKMQREEFQDPWKPLVEVLSVHSSGKA